MLQSLAGQLAATLLEDGIVAYVMELLHTIRYAVELRFGAGAGVNLARVVPVVQMMVHDAGTKQIFDEDK
eukprot:2558878-Amphidinium_carterae.1